MPRTLSLNNDGDLVFKEFVWDDDEDNISHPLPNIVELDKVDGKKQSSANRNPTWLDVTVNELGVNNTKERWEERLEVIIRDANSNLTAGTYTFLFRADDGKEQTDRLVTLQVV